MQAEKKHHLMFFIHDVSDYVDRPHRVASISLLIKWKNNNRKSIAMCFFKSDVLLLFDLFWLFLLLKKFIDKNEKKTFKKQQIDVNSHKKPAQK